MGKKKICPVCGNEVGFIGITWDKGFVKRFGKPEYEGKKLHFRCRERIIREICQTRREEKIALLKEEIKERKKKGWLRLKEKYTEELREKTLDWTKKVFIYRITKIKQILDFTGNVIKTDQELVIEIMLEHGYQLQNIVDSSSFWVDISDTKLVFVKKD